MLFNPRYGRIGMVAMPMMIIEDLIGPPIELIGYLVLPMGFWMDIISWQVAVAFLCMTAVFGTALSVGALALEERQLRPSPTAKDLAMLASAATTSSAAAPSKNVKPQSKTVWKKRFTLAQKPSPVGVDQMASVQPAWCWPNWKKTTVISASVIRMGKIQ